MTRRADTPDRSDLRDRYAALDAARKRRAMLAFPPTSRGLAIVWLILVVLALLALIRSVG